MSFDWLERIKTAKLPPLSRGKHYSPAHGLCAMEMIAFMEGYQHTDRPPNVDSTLGRAMRNINDLIVDDAARQRLVPLLPLLVDSSRHAYAPVFVDVIHAANITRYDSPYIYSGNHPDAEKLFGYRLEEILKCKRGLPELELAEVCMRHGADVMFETLERALKFAIRSGERPVGFNPDTAEANFTALMALCDLPKPSKTTIHTQAITMDELNHAKHALYLQHLEMNTMYAHEFCAALDKPMPHTFPHSLYKAMKLGQWIKPLPSKPKPSLALYHTADYATENL